MKEIILNKIAKINIGDICKFKDLISSEAMSEVIIKSGKISFAIDISILAIDFKIAQNLVEKIKKELAEVTSNPINIILTSNQSSQSFQQKEPEKKTTVNGVKNIIMVAAGKGGVGKSTIATNLAISLKRIGYKIGLVDADIYGPSIAYLMNLKGKPESENNLMIPINNYGVDCISVGSLVEANKAAVWRGPMITKVLTQLISGTKWQDIDYLIIDLPPGTGDVQLSLAQQFKPDGVLLVCTPQNLAVIDVIKAADMFKTLQIPILGVIQNMAYLLGENGNKNYIFGKDGGKKMAENLGLKFLGDIPISTEINQNNDDQNPISNQNPNHPIALEFGIIAEDLIDSLAM